MLFTPLLAVFVAGLSSVSSLVVCRVNSSERVTCPDAFYCCGVDQCCKLTFQTQDEQSRESMEDWVLAFCLRTAIVSAFMILLFAVGTSVQYCRKQYMNKFCTEEIKLPKYKPLQKNITTGTEGTNMSVLIGTPFYQVDSEPQGSLRGGICI